MNAKHNILEVFPYTVCQSCNVKISPFVAQQTPSFQIRKHFGEELQELEKQKNKLTEEKKELEGEKHKL